MIRKYFRRVGEKSVLAAPCHSRATNERNLHVEKDQTIKLKNSEILEDLGFKLAQLTPEGGQRLKN